MYQQIFKENYTPDPVVFKECEENKTEVYAPFDKPFYYTPDKRGFQVTFVGERSDVYGYVKAASKDGLLIGVEGPDADAGEYELKVWCAAFPMDYVMIPVRVERAFDGLAERDRP